jgi:hypothetical protein
MNAAVNRSRDPTASGGGVCQSTDLVFWYQRVAWSGSEA